jgi:hypothetical protein
MSIIPDVKVEIEVDPSAGLQPFFTLDDAVTGVLDGDFGLGGLAYADISIYVQSVSVERGKTNLLDNYDAGNASIVLDNTQRIFDPLGTSPFAGQLLPRRGIRIFSDNVYLFDGIVEDWQLNYDKGGDNTAAAVATDRFLLLANQELDAYTNTEQKSGDRINTVLNKAEVLWPAGARDIETGQVDLYDDVVTDNTNVLNYLQLVSLSELGSLFIAKDGKLTFYDRLKGPDSANLLVFADDGTGLPFQEVAVIIGGEFLFNRVLVFSSSGTSSPQLVEDLTSQGFFGISNLSRTDLLMKNDSDALAIANTLLVKYRNPAYRFESVTTDLNSLTDTQVQEVLLKDLTDVIKVIFTPNNIGSPVEKYGQIIGIKHNIERTGSHRITFNLDTLDYAPFVLDDLVFGELDEYGLG